MTAEYALGPQKGLWRRVLAHKFAAPAKKTGALFPSHTRVPAWATLKTGQRLKVDLSSSVGRSIWFRGSYEPGVEAHIMRILQQGDAFIDVGANVGYFSLIAANLVGTEGEVHSFEPSRTVCELLKASIAKNSVQNVYAMPIALWSESRTLDLATQHNSGFTHVSPEGTHDNLAHLENVTAITLDQYVKSHVRRPIKLVKIDVEGAEIHVLRGMAEMLRSHKPCLIIEAVDWLLSRFGHRLEDMFGLLEGHGYAAYDLEGHATRSAEEARRRLHSARVVNLLFTKGGSPC
jgi:FkbM family methyltransferase